MKKGVKLALAGLLALACAAYGAFVLLTPISVRTERLAVGELGDSFTAQAALTPTESLVLSSDADGVLRALPFRVGERVAAGTALFELDDSLMRRQQEDQLASLRLQQTALYAQHRTGLAELAIRTEQLRAQALSARQQYETLYGDPDVAGARAEAAADAYGAARLLFRDAESNSALYSPEQLEAIREQMFAARQNMIVQSAENNETSKSYYRALAQSAEAQLAQLESTGAEAAILTEAAAAQLALTIADLEEKLTKAPPTAPYDAVVWELYGEEGAFVAQHQPVLKLYRSGSFTLEADLLTEDAARLKTGESMRFTLPDGAESAATLRFISPVAAQQLSSVGIYENRCRVELDPQGELPAGVGAGQRVDVVFTATVAREALSVPASAIVPSGQGSAVYLLEDETARLTPVETGRRAGGRVEIVEGLKVGDTLILEPYDSGVKDKARVKVAG